ncbi:hypothetical protein [Oharaeibacter diazotrophicus]|uniref:Uncharacterized protein n=3 Tax=Oharaeibacter diazotrophicus TaxID=1920512 RepID=A0A4R6RK78_9HYPH|nr:hypothetical protein [Oharaeibacter diazotrophicus]TDP86505.1 hypothetical protein EDD54_0382 [Oharaeibacter diazotrophicus]BBE71553.1 hypothetical protein OHA_1_01129 [Pleomorphomonas sp. SM30]GLS78313.1 hypothetical protein GCM10007904_36500 [Oharaeibacter diazotrophicus]
MRFLGLIAGVTSLAVGTASLVHALPTVTAAARFASAAAGLDPLTTLAVVRASAAGSVIADLRAAVAADDRELADSLLALADARDIAVPADLRAAVADLAAPTATVLRGLRDFGGGALTGSAESLAGFAGVATADLLVIGDVRDLGREAAVWAGGGEPDLLVAGLSAVGIALTAGTVATAVSTVASAGATAPMAGGAATARGGLSVVKAVLKAPVKAGEAGGRGLRRILVPLVDDAVDPSALARAASAFDIADPGAAVRVAREAVDLRKAGRIGAVAADFAAVRAASGLRTAVWLGGRVETPADLARGTARLTRLGDKGLAVTWRLGDLVVGGVLRLAGLVWDVLATAVGAVLGLAFGAARLGRSLGRIGRAGRRKWRISARRAGVSV